MNGLIKRIFLCLLCLLLFCAVCAPAASALQDDDPGVQTDVQDEGVDVKDEGVDVQDEGADTPFEPEQPAEDPVVARLYLCCRVLFFGHTWIYVENKTSEPIRVGVIYTAPGTGVSVGTHKYRRADGGGVYYNVEAYMLKGKGTSATVARAMDLRQSQLQTVNDTIVNNNSWSLSDNCNRFATRVWNSVAPDTVSYAFLPLTEKGRIGSGGAPSMTDPGRDMVLRQNGSGYGASTYRVKDASLICGIG